VTLKRLATEPVYPLEVTFRHRPPASLVEHSRILGPAVRFDQPHNAIVYRSTTLATTFQKSFSSGAAK